MKKLLIGVISLLLFITIFLSYSFSVYPPQGTQRTASTTHPGVVELATDAETIAGTSDTVVTTPGNIAALLADFDFMADLVDDTTPQLGADLDCNTHSILYSAAQTKTITLTGFDTGNETVSGNITGTDGNNMQVREVRVYISTDPTADENINFRLSFYNSDSMTEDELVGKGHSLNLTYTETNGGVTATDTTDTVDDGSGLVIYDLIRFHAGGGTAENQRLTAAPTATGLTFTAAGYDHTDNAGIVRVHEITDSFFLVDADASNEIHIKLQALSAATASMSVIVEVDLQ